ncbi:hypothetical protein M426DRAFT_324397 [Hypoxylon sp. CI-4A]|nr:hypothetical protein M426DRAFT_324397 [Hypoxylon sp. CI-4A]
MFNGCLPVAHRASILQQQQQQPKLNNSISSFKMDNTPDNPQEPPSSCTSPGECTPTTSSTMTNNFEKQPDTPVYKEEIPTPGNAYIIREPVSGLQITLIDGVLRMSPSLGIQGGYQWQCSDSRGWMSF